MNGVAHALLRPILGLTVGVLAFNLTQRRHLRHGEAKRFASLGIAGLLLVLYAGTWAVNRYNLGMPALAAVAIAVTAVGAVFRNRLFTFKFHCARCGNPLPIKRTLYYDDNLCAECERRDNSDIPNPRRTWPGGEVPREAKNIDWEAWEPDEDAVLCFIRRDDELLLIHKKTGLGAGKINAPGGRIEPEETARDAAVRETEEETGVTPIDPIKRVDLSFVFTNGYSLHGSVFLTERYTGEPAATDEADPFWCRISELPFSRMWEDDAVWLPELLSGKTLTARFVFDGDRMVSSFIEAGL